MNDYMSAYRDDWQEIVELPDGTLNLDQVARELYDYGNLMRWASEVYDYVSGGLISKPNTLPSAVMDLADERADEAEREVIKELIRNIEEHADGPFASVAEVIALIRELTETAAGEVTRD